MALALFQLDRTAEKLQQVYEEALQTMEAAVPEVWPDDGQQKSQAPVRTSGNGSVGLLKSEQELSLDSLFQLTGPNTTANSIMTSFQQLQQSPAAPPQGQQDSFI